MHRRTVRQFLRATEFPERAPPRRRPSQHTPFHDYLRERWEQGCHNAAQLYREVLAKGFPGSASALRQYLRAWRTQLPETLRDRRGQKAGTAPPVITFSLRTTAWLLLGYAKSKESRQQTVNEAFLDQLKTLCPAIVQAQALATAFLDLGRQRQGDALKAWIEQLCQSELAELISLDRGLTDDYEAVLAGISSAWSNGQTEGQVNRLKLIKRSMYGRAKFDLLKARVLPRGQAA